MRHLLDLARDISVRRDWAALAFLSFIGTVAAILLSVPFTSAGTQLQMARFHRRGTFSEWAIFQAIPAMYNFRNRVWVYPGIRPPNLPVDTGKARRDGSLRFRFVNHHTYRAVVNPLEASLPSRGCLTSVLISDYRDRWLRTEYQVCRESENRFHIARNDP